MSILKCIQISKRYRKKQVLNNINLEFNPGEITVIAGLNGIGKTTLLKILSGNLKPSEGNVVLGSKNIIDVSNLTDVLLIEDENILPSNLKINELVELFKLKNKRFDEKYLNEYVIKLGLDLNAPIGSLSKGNKELVQLGVLLSNRPKYVLMDEPLAAVDVVKREILYDLLIDLQLEGVGVIFTTHIISEVEKIVSRLVLIDNGMVVCDDTVDNIYESGFDSLNSYFVNKLGERALYNK